MDVGVGLCVGEHLYKSKVEKTLTITSSHNLLQILKYSHISLLSLKLIVNLKQCFLNCTTCIRITGDVY